MPSKKVYITLIIILIVFFIIMFLAFGVNNIRQENLSSTLIVGDKTAFSLNKRKWIYLRTNTSMEKYNWVKFHVFEDNKELGDYLLWHDDKWYAFDENKKAVVINGKMLAYYSNYEMKVLDFQEENVDDYTFVNQVLSDKNLTISSRFTSIYKVLVDYDSDGSNEEFYIISNVFPADFEPETSFAIAFMVKNNQIYYLYNDISTYTGNLNGCKPFYHSFIDTNYDGIYEVIVSCGRYSADDQVDMLFGWNENDFNLLISNQ